MFSREYARRAVSSAARNPGAFLRGGGSAIYDKRMREWLRTRQAYRDSPKETLGFKIFLDPEDMSPISSLIATSGYANLPVTCLLKAVLRRGMKVVDVGANLGFYAMVAARAVGPAGKVWAVEPEPHNFTLMRRSLEASGMTNVEPLQMALSKGARVERLYLAPASEPNAHTLTQDRGAGSLEVAASSLDDFWRERGGGKLDLLKVHVFGDEAVVLGGARRVLEESRPMVVTRFGSARWSDDPGLLDDLFAWYDVYEIVDSPRLVRPMARSEAVAETRAGVFLKPKRAANP